MGTIIEHLRSGWLPNRPPLVIMCPRQPSRAELRCFDILEDPHIAILTGSPRWVPDLLKAGVADASVILCPSLELVYPRGVESNIHSEELAMVDADSVVLF